MISAILESATSSGTALGKLVGNGSAGLMLPTVNERLPLDEAIQALRRDPTHPVVVKVDEGLTVEVRAVEATGATKKTVGDLLREVGRWEGETGADLDALFTRQPGNRRVPDLP
ncbi:MAG: hypothetical protein R3B13_38000 [Polyangiaceae bacterium]